jgi:alpha-ribazole phosphatase
VIRASQLLAKGLRQVNRADQWPHDAPAFGQWCCIEFSA